MAKPHASIFATQSIDVLVKAFDFSQMNTKDSKSEDYLHVTLAPSYGTLKDGSVLKAIDDKLAVMIGTTMSDLEKMPPNKRSWQNITAAFMQNPLLEPRGDAIERSDCFTNKSVSRFKIDRSPDPSIVQEVMTWFTELIQDADILQSTAIDIEVMAKIVAQSGAAIVNFPTIFYREEKCEKTIVDIGVLRFPDPDHPYCKVYRITLRAWAKSTRIAYKQDDSNGIACDFLSRSFKPRGIIDEVEKDITRKLAAEAREKMLEALKKPPT